jgi:TPR repeat protein
LSASPNCSISSVVRLHQCFCVMACIFEQIHQRAAWGDAHAQYHLAIAHYRGRGVAQDLTAAFPWYSKAAEQGHTYAEWQLGRMYLFGFGVPRNKFMAHVWLSIAVENGLNTRGHRFSKFLVGLFLTKKQRTDSMRRVRAWWDARPQQLIVAYTRPAGDVSKAATNNPLTS